MRKTFYFVSCIILSSCSLFHPPKLNSYYKKVVSQEAKSVTTIADAKKIVEIETYYVRPDQITPSKDESKNVFTLLERGQEKYIEVLGLAYKDKPDDFIKNVAAPFKTSTPIKNESIIDKSEFHIKLNLNIIDKLNDNKPANRISSLKVNFNMDNLDVSFFKFDNIQTKYEVIDFGKMINTDGQSLSLNAGADVVVGTTANAFDAAGNNTKVNSSSNTPTFGAAFTTENSSTQEMLLTKRVLSQNASLSKRTAFVSMEGTPTNNLEGPLNIEFTLKADSVIEHSFTKFDKFFEKDTKTNKEKPIDQDKIKSTTIFYRVPNIKGDSVTISLKYTYNYREVLKNDNTVMESDDHIQFHKGNPKEHTVVTGVRKGDLKMLGYYLWDETSKKYLSKENASLAFETPEEADSFRKWLLASQSTMLQNKKLTLIDQASHLTPITLNDIKQFDLIINPNNIYELISPLPAGKK